MRFKRGKRAQVTIFIILAIVIVAAVVLFFSLRGTVQKQTLPAFVEPVENSFLSCLEQDVETGIAFLEINGGNLEQIDFEPGSKYMPFSSHLNFLGNEIPYWFYMSSNNLPRENIPSLESMENQLEKYVEENIKSCGLEDFYDENYDISKGLVQADVFIRDNEVEVDLNMNLAISKEEESYIIKDHNIVVKSKLGSLYKDALEIYDQEQNTLFLENFGVDVLRLYAPVDGVELKCSPMTWNADEVFSDVKEALEINTFALNTAGDKKDYFAVENSLKNNARFIYSQDWPSTFEVAPNEGSLLIAKPVGNQPGLGILGFCYVTYHHVYNLAYPTLVQVYSEDEIFQFPTAIVIRGNVPREALQEEDISVQEPYDVCKDKLASTEINIYDYNFIPVVADVSYECFGSRCDLGTTSEQGYLYADIPQCVNGNLIVDGEGFKNTKVLYSSVYNGSSTIILDKEFERPVSIYIDGKLYSGEAIISFLSQDSVQTLSYPSNKNVDLSEGTYEIQVQVYKNSSLNFASTTREQCVEIPSSGIGGLFGATKEECFEINVPEQLISTVLAGGGVSSFHFSENTLINSEEVALEIGALSVPKTIDELQKNYISLESKTIGVSLR